MRRCVPYVLALALLACAPCAAQARVKVGTGHADRLRGGPHRDVLKGGGGNDRISGGKGNDRLSGGRGNDRISGGAGRDRISGGPGRDRISGGPGRDRINCGKGRDMVRIGAGDRAARNCEVVLTGKTRKPSPKPQCHYRTKPVLVLENGSYVYEERVVLECPGAKTPAKTPPASPYRGILAAYWYQYDSFPAFYRLSSDGTGARTTYPTGDVRYGQTYPFAWSVAGSELTLRFTSGYVDRIHIVRYDSAHDTLYRTSAESGNGPWYGCRSGNFQAFLYANVC